MKKHQNLSIIINYIITYIVFAALSIGLLLLSQYLVSKRIISNNYSWIFIVLRYIIAVIGILIYGKKVAKVTIDFKLQKTLPSLIGWIVVIAVCIYNMWDVRINLNSNTNIENFMFCLGPAVFEELWLRGVVYKKLLVVNRNTKYDLTKAIIVSALLFMISHVFISDYSSSTLELAQCITALGLGILFAVTYYVTRNLAATMLMHFANNANSYFAGGAAPFFNNLNTIQFSILSFVIHLILAGVLLVIASKVKNKMSK